MKKFIVGKKGIGENSPAFIIAELSANHNQDYDIAVKTIKAAKEAGADAIKLQTYTPDTMTIDSDKKYFKINKGTIWDGTTLYNLYKTAYTPWEWHEKLKKLSEDLGLVFFSTPCDKTAVDFLEKLNVPLYKVTSFEITDIPLIEYIASKGKPVVLSTGISTLEDINLALEACKRQKNDKIILLKCTSSYPAKFEEMDLKTIPDMKKRFNTVVGLSDHSMSNINPILSVALGAKVIEKHFIVDRKIGGPDSSFSLEPEEFKEMVKSVRNAEKALGKINYELSEKSKKNREFSRSLFVVKDIQKGDTFKDDNIRSIRPGDGLHPKYYDQVLGKKALKDLEKGEPLRKDDVEGL